MLQAVEGNDRINCTWIPLYRKRKPLAFTSYLPKSNTPRLAVRPAVCIYVLIVSAG